MLSIATASKSIYEVNLISWTPGRNRKKIECDAWRSYDCVCVKQKEEKKNNRNYSKTCMKCIYKAKTIVATVQIKVLWARSATATKTARTHKSTHWINASQRMRVCVSMRQRRFFCTFDNCVGLSDSMYDGFPFCLPVKRVLFTSFNAAHNYGKIYDTSVYHSIGVCQCICWYCLSDGV